MTLTVVLPKKEGKPVGADFDIDKFKQRHLERMMDIIEAFSPKIIASVKRRMQACQQLLLNHVNDIEYNDGRHIIWKRKDGSSGCFNIPSFEAMQSVVEKLASKQVPTLVETDQILKALLNDTEPTSHEDCKGYKWSELISILCELHVFHGE